MKCPLCNSESTFAFNAKGFDICDCKACGHRFTALEADESHVESVYDDSYFNGGGAGYSDYVAEGEMLQKRGEMYADILEARGVRHGKMLDVGSAAGFILKGFATRGWNAQGLEPNAAMAKFAQETLGVETTVGSLETFDASEEFDLVTIIQVAAHFYAPREAFQKAFDILKPGGHLLIETWNRESFSARIFGKNWHEYSPPSVLQFFSEKGLTAFLKDFGFEKTGGGRPAKKISGAHARSLLKYRIGDSFLLKLIPEKINFPYPSEDLFWALYRKQ